MDAKDDFGPGLQTSSLADLGRFKKLLGSDDHKWHVNELMNDHNAICHIDINFVSIFIDIVSLKVMCRKQDVLKLVECVCKLFVNIFCV